VAAFFCERPAIINEPAGKVQLVDTISTASAPSAEEADAQPSDTIERTFSPMNDAVARSNRDLNKGDADTPSDANE